MKEKEISMKFIEEEREFIKQSDSTFIIGICAVCYSPFIMKWGHDETCSECKQIINVF